jgi:hypothetical protein
VSRPLQVFCHVFTAGWSEPLRDLTDGFNAADLKRASPTVKLGIVGPEVGRDAVLERLANTCELEAELVAYEQLGNESVTLNALREWACSADPDGAVLYCHTKGASRPMELNTRWRRAMIDAVVLPWAELLGKLDWSQAMGPFWIPMVVAPYPLGSATGFFGGNFWIARNDYLAQLPLCSPGRQESEYWIAEGHPAIVNLLPGYPDYEYFGLPNPTS